MLSRGGASRGGDRMLERATRPDAVRTLFMRQVKCDLMRPSVRSYSSSLRAHKANVTVRQLRPDVALVRPVAPPRCLQHVTECTSRANPSVRSSLYLLGQLSMPRYK